MQANLCLVRVKLADHTQDYVVTRYQVVSQRRPNWFSVGGVARFMKSHRHQGHIDPVFMC